MALSSVLASVLALSACGFNDAGTPVVTVTVTPTDEAAATPTSATPSSVPTVAATPTAPSSTTPTTPTVPTALAAGAQRGAPHSYAEASRSIRSGRESARVDGVFVSPSGNIFCTIGVGSTPACEVADGRTKPPEDGICSADGPKDVGRIELTGAGAVPVCNSDTVRRGTPPTLPYGSRAEAPGSTVSCLSERVGVTCVDSATEHGFFVAKRTFVTF